MVRGRQCHVVPGRERPGRAAETGMPVVTSVEAAANSCSAFRTARGWFKHRPDVVVDAGEPERIGGLVGVRELRVVDDDVDVELEGDAVVANADGSVLSAEPRRLAAELLDGVADGLRLIA